MEEDTTVLLAYIGLMALVLVMTFILCLAGKV